MLCELSLTHFCENCFCCDFAVRKCTKFIMIEVSISDLLFYNIILFIAGQLLNFNISLTLFLTPRYLFTQLNKYGLLKRLIPFDDLHFLHKSVATITLFLSLVHTIAHALNIGMHTIVYLT